MPDDTGVPADARLNQQVSLIGTITQHFDVADMRDARNLRCGVLQQSLLGVGFTDDASEGRKRPLVAHGFVRIDQGVPILWINKCPAGRTHALDEVADATSGAERGSTDVGVSHAGVKAVAQRWWRHSMRLVTFALGQSGTVAMAKKRMVLEIGMGTDIRGADPTKAACRALRDALWHNSLSIATALGQPLDAMIVDVHIGVPRPEMVDKAEVMAVLPYGKGFVSVVEGGLEIHNDKGTDSTLIANACVVVSLDIV
jgi:uncharacterized protein (TIGR02058 family)